MGRGWDEQLLLSDQTDLADQITEASDYNLYRFNVWSKFLYTDPLSGKKWNPNGSYWNCLLTIIVIQKTPLQIESSKNDNITYHLITYTGY